MRLNTNGEINKANRIELVKANKKIINPFPYE